MKYISAIAPVFGAYMLGTGQVPNPIALAIAVLAQIILTILTLSGKFEDEKPNNP
jgi:hypothetical protein